MSGTIRPMQPQPTGASRLSPGATSGKALMLGSPSSCKGAGGGAQEVFAVEPFGNLDKLRGQHPEWSTARIKPAHSLPTRAPPEGHFRRHWPSVAVNLTR